MNILILFKDFLEIIGFMNKIANGLINIRIFSDLVDFIIFIVFVIMFLWSLFIKIVGKTNYDKLKKVQKNKKILRKIIIKNKYSIKERSLFIITNILLFLCYTYVLFQENSNKYIISYLRMIIPFSMFIVYAFDIKTLFKK